MIFIKDHGKIFHLRIPSRFMIVYQPKKGLSLFANRYFRGGEKISRLSGKLVKSDMASPEAVQFNEKYFLDAKNYVCEDFINHSCDPNSSIDLKKRTFIALKDIKKDEEITYNYLTTEYDMQKMGTAFYCSCGAKNCFQKIRGFKYLKRKQKIKLKPLLTPYLLGKI